MSEERKRKRVCGTVPTKTAPKATFSRCWKKDATPKAQAMTGAGEAIGAAARWRMTSQKGAAGVERKTESVSCSFVYSHSPIARRFA